MTAFDADDPATDNAALRYNIVRQSPDKPFPNMFYIDAERGDIVTVISDKLLDREVSSLGKRVHMCVCECSVSRHTVWWSFSNWNRVWLVLDRFLSQVSHSLPCLSCSFWFVYSFSTCQSVYIQYVYALYATYMCVCLGESKSWCIPVGRHRSQMSVSPFPPLSGARQRDDCFFSRVTNARTSIGFAGGRGILAVVRHLAHSLIEVIHTHPPALVVSNKPGWKPPIRNCWNHGG